MTNPTKKLIIGVCSNFKDHELIYGVPEWSEKALGTPEVKVTCKKCDYIGQGFLYQDNQAMQDKAEPGALIVPKEWL